MTFGIPTDTFLLFHVLVSLLGIASGLVVLYGLLSGRPSGFWTALFLVTTVLTSLTGFPLPPFGFDPPRAIGIVLLVLLAFAIAAVYVFRLSGPWRWIYVGAGMAALYLNCFVGVVQAFQKLPFLKPLAPTQSEPPFIVAQLVVLALFAALGITAVIRFHPEARPAR